MARSEYELPTESGFSRGPLKHHRAPWMPVPYQLQHMVAARALMAGTATAAQQTMFMEYLIEHVARTGDQSYHPESARDSDFAEGRRFVGNTILKLIKLPMPRNREDA